MKTDYAPPFSKAELDEEQQRVESLKQVLDVAERQARDAKQQLPAGMLALVSNLESAQQAHQRIQQQLREVAHNMDAFQQSMDANVRQLLSFETQLEELTAKCQSAEAEHDQIQQRLRETEELASAARSRLEHCEQEHEKRAVEQSKMLEEVTFLHNEVAEHEAALQFIESSLNAQAKKIQEQEAERRERNITIEQLDHELQTLRARVPDIAIPALEAQQEDEGESVAAAVAVAAAAAAPLDRAKLLVRDRSVQSPLVVCCARSVTC